MTSEHSRHIQCIAAIPPYPDVTAVTLTLQYNSYSRFEILQHTHTFKEK